MFLGDVRGWAAPAPWGGTGRRERARERRRVGVGLVTSRRPAARTRSLRGGSEAPWRRTMPSARGGRFQICALSLCAAARARLPCRPPFVLSFRPLSFLCPCFALPPSFRPQISASSRHTSRAPNRRPTPNPLSNAALAPPHASLSLSLSLSLASLPYVLRRRTLAHLPRQTTQPFPFFPSPFPSPAATRPRCLPTYLRTHARTHPNPMSPTAPRPTGAGLAWASRASPV
ncbi:hypothetical protein BDY21DRAFT_330918, partial [Lineolata rhizophorae]